MQGLCWCWPRGHDIQGNNIIIWWRLIWVDAYWHSCSHLQVMYKLENEMIVFQWKALLTSRHLLICVTGTLCLVLEMRYCRGNTSMSPGNHAQVHYAHTSLHSEHAHHSVQRYMHLKPQLRIIHTEWTALSSMPMWCSAHAHALCAYIVHVTFVQPAC